MIYFFFVHESVPGGFGRRAAWIVYAVIFLVLWYMRGDVMGASNTIYIIGLVLVIVALFFDKSIHKYFRFSDFGRAEERIENAEVVNLLHQLKRAREVYDSTGNRQAFEQISHITKTLKNMGVNPYSIAG